MNDKGQRLSTLLSTPSDDGRAKARLGVPAALRLSAPSGHHPRLTLGIHDHGIPVVSVQPAVIATGGLAHDAEPLKMLERAAGLKAGGSLKSNVQRPKSGRKEKG